MDLLELFKSYFPLFTPCIIHLPILLLVLLQHFLFNHQSFLLHVVWLGTWMAEMWHLTKWLEVKNVSWRTLVLVVFLMASCCYWWGNQSPPRSTEQKQQVDKWYRRERKKSARKKNTRWAVRIRSESMRKYRGWHCICESMNKYCQYLLQRGNMYKSKTR